MSDPRERLHLLEEILPGAEREARHEQVRQLCHQELGRRRWAHRARTGLVLGAVGVAALLLLVLALAGPGNGDPAGGDRPAVPPPSPPPGPPAYLVRSRAADPSIRVTTAPADRRIVHTRRAAVQMDDEALLASFEGHPRALISRGSGRKQLLFLDPADQDRFFPEP